MQSLDNAQLRFRNFVICYFTGDRNIRASSKKQLCWRIKKTTVHSRYMVGSMCQPLGATRDVHYVQIQIASKGLG